MDNIYQYTGIVFFWVIIFIALIASIYYGAVLFAMIRLKAKATNWIHYYILRGRIDSNQLRKVFKYPWVVNKPGNRKFIFLYRLRNIKYLKEETIK